MGDTHFSRQWNGKLSVNHPMLLFWILRPGHNPPSTQDAWCVAARKMDISSIICFSFCFSLVREHSPWQQLFPFFPLRHADVTLRFTRSVCTRGYNVSDTNICSRVISRFFCLRLNRSLSLLRLVLPNANSDECNREFQNISYGTEKIPKRTSSTCWLKHCIFCWLWYLRIC